MEFHKEVVELHRPLFFSIFTNKLPLVLKNAKIAMYTDDSTVYITESTADALVRVLNRELQLVFEWVTNNKLVLNVVKTKSIMFGRKQLLINKPKLKVYVKDVAVEQVQEK